MKRNESGLDRIIRVVIGLVFIGLFAAGVVVGWLGWLLLVIGAILLGTGIIGFCPLYAALKLNTNKKAQ
jgi:hypothetical protein